VNEQLLKSTPLSAATLSAADCVIIITPHTQTDWELVAAYAPVIVDTRNALKGRAPNGHLLRL
jgi:UDP-N-acetyl-D-glucosamine dehydrogenase